MLSTTCPYGAIQRAPKRRTPIHYSVCKVLPSYSDWSTANRKPLSIFIHPRLQRRLSEKDSVIHANTQVRCQASADHTIITTHL
jgi:hypothetical protein